MTPTPATNYLTRLVVAVTTPDEAEIALPWVRTLASQLHLTLVFAYVLDPARATVQTEPLDVSEAIARDYLRILASDSRLARLTVQTTLLIGSPADELPRFAEHQPGSVLVLVRGDRGDTGSFVGQATEGVIQRMTTPFIVIPSHASPPSTIRSIVVGNDRSALAENVLQTSQTFGHSMDLIVLAVEVVEPNAMPHAEFLQLTPTFSERRIQVRGLASRHASCDSTSARCGSDRGGCAWCRRYGESGDGTNRRLANKSR